MNKNELLSEILEILTKHIKIKAYFGKDYEKDRQLFRGLCNQSLTLDGIDERFYELQDELLSIERNEKGIVDTNNLNYKDNITIWQGDITRLKADVIVNAANDNYLGCFVPNHNCIDNIIMSSSGFQMRNELLKLKESKDYKQQKVKVTKGYNLPCKYVFHISGPQIINEVTKKDEQSLMNCYIYCLNKAKEMNLKSIAFCCISTGVFSFPNNLACKIAVSTINKWLKETNGKLKIIFNVYKDIDKELYEKELSR